MITSKPLLKELLRVYDEDRDENYILIIDTCLPMVIDVFYNRLYRDLRMERVGREIRGEFQPE